MQPESEAAWVSAAQLADALGVSQPVVGNWRKRYDDFPGTRRSERGTHEYNLQQVKEWVGRRGLGASQPDAERAARNAVTRAADLLRGVTSDPYRFILAALCAVKAGSSPEAPSWPKSPLMTPELSDIVASAFADLERVGGTPSLFSHHFPVSLLVLRDLPGGFSTAVAATDRLSMRYGHAAGEAASAEPLTDLVASLISRHKANAVFDPACGNAGMLTRVSQQLNATAHGIEWHPQTLESALMRAFLLDATLNVTQGDSLLLTPEPKYDVVVCDPPYGLRREADSYGRAIAVEPGRIADWAWPQLIVAALNQGGEAYCILPTGALKRRDGAEIRRDLVRRGCVEAVIALPSGLGVTTRLPLSILVLRAPGARQKQPILMVDFSEAARSGRGHREPDLSPLVEIVQAFRAGSASAEDRRATVVDPLDLMTAGAELSPVDVVREATRGRGYVADLDVLVSQITDAAETLSATTAAWEPRGFTIPIEHVTVAQLVRDGRADIVRVRRLEPDVLQDELEPTGSSTRRVGVITSRSLRAGGPLSPGVWVSEALASTSSLTQAGDVLFLTVGDGVSKVDEHGGHLVQSPVGILRLDSSIDPYLVAAAISSPYGRSALTSGSGRIDLSSLAVPAVPPERAVPLRRLILQLDQLEGAAEHLVDRIRSVRQTGFDDLASAAVIRLGATAERSE